MGDMPKMFIDVLGTEVPSFMAVSWMPKSEGLERTLVRGEGKGYALTITRLWAMTTFHAEKVLQLRGLLKPFNSLAAI